MWNSRGTWWIILAWAHKQSLYCLCPTVSPTTDRADGNGVTNGASGAPKKYLAWKLMKLNHSALNDLLWLLLQTIIFSLVETNSSSLKNEPLLLLAPYNFLTFHWAWLCRQEVEMMVSVTFGCPFFPAEGLFINAILINLAIFIHRPDPKVESF